MDNQEIQLLKKRIATQLEKRNHRHDINRLQQYIKQTIQTDRTKFLLSVNEEIIRKQQKIQELNHRAQQLNTKIKKLKRRQQAEIRRQIKEQEREQERQKALERERQREKEQQKVIEKTQKLCPLGSRKDGYGSQKAPNTVESLLYMTLPKGI